MKFVAPSVKETGFNCPHCHVLAKHYWFYAHAEPIKGDGLPITLTPSNRSEFNFDRVEDETQRHNLVNWADRLSRGDVFLEKQPIYADYTANNVCFSRCTNCKDVSVWIWDRLVYPSTGTAPEANPDTPPDIRRDYEEASQILALSPRGAAALLRLAIQKLCKELGQAGENINADIGALVALGLDPRIQRALDVVRVIGNESVHPGQIDLRDDSDTARTLFRLFNIIVERMITEPKMIDAVYASLPPAKLAAIEKRDAKALPYPDGSEAASK